MDAASCEGGVRRGGRLALGRRDLLLVFGILCDRRSRHGEWRDVWYVAMSRRITSTRDWWRRGDDSAETRAGKSAVEGNGESGRGVGDCGSVFCLVCVRFKLEGGWCSPFPCDHDDD